MALVEKSRSVFPFGFGAGTNGRTLKSLRFLIVFGLAFFALGFGFGHGYWFVALWSAAAALAWVFMRGASDASLPADRPRDD